MHANFKHIYIDKLIAICMKECGIEVYRAATFLKVNDEDIK